MFLYSLDMEPKSPFRCFDRRYMTEVIVIALVLVGLAIVGRRVERGSWVRIALALLQAACFAFLIARTLLPIRKLDELQQRIHLIAIAVSFGITGTVVTASEYLARAGIAMPPAGLWVWALMVGAWWVGVLVLSRRFR